MDYQESFNLFNPLNDRYSDNGLDEVAFNSFNSLSLGNSVDLRIDDKLSTLRGEEIQLRYYPHRPPHIELIVNQKAYLSATRGDLFKLDNGKIEIHLVSWQLTFAN